MLTVGLLVILALAVLVIACKRSTGGAVGYTRGYGYCPNMGVCADCDVCEED